MPCTSPTGVTVNALTTLASRCLHLSTLRIHFQENTLANVGTNTETIALSNNELVFLREDCALTDLEVGAIPIPLGSAVRIALSLLQNFRRTLNIGSDDPVWKSVAGTTEDFRWISVFVGRAGKT